MKKDQLFRLIGFFIVLAISFLFVVNNVFSVTEGALYTLFPPNSQVENIVFLIGDVMGLTQINSTRIKTVGANGKLYIERMPFTELINTDSANNLVIDSANALIQMVFSHFGNSRNIRYNWLREDVKNEK